MTPRINGHPDEAAMERLSVALHALLVQVGAETEPVSLVAVLGYELGWWVHRAVHEAAFTPVEIDVVLDDICDTLRRQVRDTVNYLK